jgi:FlaA1/EpsC-like NDP-sugar epimerase
MNKLSKLGQRLAQLQGRIKLALLLSVDGVSLPLAFSVAALLSGGGSTEWSGTLIMQGILAGLITQLALFRAGLYHSVLRFIDLRAVTRTAVGLSAAVALIFALLLYSNDRLGMSPSTPAIYWFVAFTYLMTSRFVARSILQKGLRRTGRGGRRSLIYGAGSAGVQIARAMSFSPEYEAVCFVDDDPRLHRRIVAGLPVFNPADLKTVVTRCDVDQVVVAVPSAPASVRRALMHRIEKLGLPAKTLPGLLDLVQGEAHISSIRNINVTDLLGRDAVPPDPALFSRSLRDKVVMVTGAGGSIGSELCRQILSQQPHKLILFDHSEFGLYAIEQELLAQKTDCQLIGVLGSVLDKWLIEQTLQLYGVQTLYHAAAYKHVPIVENNMRQGILNNVFGTAAVVDAARRLGLETCVLVSTDKAVRPTNVMGATKRIAELVVQAAVARRDCHTIFSMVRFGNVLGSSGSVVPLFQRQIQSGGPITITHPDIIRYFMLIPEAAQLVIQAGAMARGGEVFVLDMGEPVRIADLARTMLRLSGLTERNTQNPDGDVEISFIGLRPGEKLYEELLIGDDPAPSGHPRILCARERMIDPLLLDKMLMALRAACDDADASPDAMLRLIRNIVPEFRPADEVNAERYSNSGFSAMG